MIRIFKDFVKTRPYLFDLLKILQRRIFSKHDPIYSFLDDFSKLHNREVTFIQVGANDGLRNDPIREFIYRDKWRGILVEPLCSVFDLLKRNYAHIANQLIFVNAAISSKDTKYLTFYTFTEDFLNSLLLEERLNYLQKASFSRSHVEHFVKNKNSKKIIREIKVPSLTLNSLIKQYGFGLKEIDLLVIDAEGHELSIISSIDFETLRPEAILFESHNLGSEKNSLFSFLHRSGYKIVEIEGDAIAIQPNPI